MTEQIKLMTLAVLAASSLSAVLTYVIVSKGGITDIETQMLTNARQTDAADDTPVPKTKIACATGDDSYDCPVKEASSIEVSAFSTKPNNDSEPQAIESKASDLSVLSTGDATSERQKIHAMLLQINESIQASSPESVVKLEAAFTETLRQDPDLLNDFASAYLQLPESSSKEVLRSLLAGTQNPALEQLAVQQIISGMDTGSGDWMRLISDMGVGTAVVRKQLLDYLPSLTNTDSLALAIHAINADVVSESERQYVLGALESSTYHESASVRGAAIEKIAAWGSTDQIHHVERGITDSDLSVRGAAISATQNSNIKSDRLKSKLLEILNNNHEDWHLRVHAFHALREFSLSGEEYEYLNEFNTLQQQRLHEARASNG